MSTQKPPFIQPAKIPSFNGLLQDEGKLQLKTPSVEQITSFQAAFDYFNQELFEGKLPPVILNFSRSRAKTIAFYAPKRWEKGEDKGKALDEISLNPVHLGRSMEEIFSSLVHEQCHLWQFVSGNPGRRGYHNREWANKMKEVGLQPVSRGGKETGESASHMIMECGGFQKSFQAMPEAFKLPWRVFIEGGGEEPKLKTKSDKVKYSCEGCGANVWGKTNLKILCEKCQISFQESS